MTMLSVEKNNWNEMYLLIKFGKEGTELWRIATKKNALWTTCFNIINVINIY